jgi:hypothetical protein
LAKTKDVNKSSCSNSKGVKIYFKNLATEKNLKIIFNHLLHLVYIILLDLLFFSDQEANSVDPDQTAMDVYADLDLHWSHMKYKSYSCSKELNVI